MLKQKTRLEIWSKHNVRSPGTLTPIARKVREVEIPLIAKSHGLNSNA